MERNIGQMSGIHYATAPAAATATLRIMQQSPLAPQPAKAKGIAIGGLAQTIRES